MIVGFSKFLKQVSSLKRFFGLCTSQNVDRVSSLNSQLKSPKGIMFSNCDDYFFLYIFKIARFSSFAWVIEREISSHFLLRRLISTKRYFLFSELNFELNSFDGSPSLMTRISPPPFRSLTNLYGLEYPSMLNCTCWKNESRFFLTALIYQYYP